MAGRVFFSSKGINMHGEVGFCEWRSWENRGEVPGKDSPGVYFIACSDTKPDSYRAHHEAIIYIGETSQRTLGRRLWEFNTSAFNGKPGHSGGHTFKRNMPDATPGHLWVSACPVALGEPYTTAYIKYLERRLLWEYVNTWGCLPPCNSM